MAEISLSIPTAGVVSPSNWLTRPQLSKLLEDIDKKYHLFISIASRTSRIPRGILTAFIAVESTGTQAGLMKWNRQSAKESLEKELAQGRMSPLEKSKLAEFGITFDSKGKTRNLTIADQQKPQLNILIGSIILGQLIDTNWGTSANGLRLDRVIAVYNSGATSLAGKKAMSGKHRNASELAADVDPITSAYIKKIMGKDGAMHVDVDDLKQNIADVFMGKKKVN